MVMSTMPVDRKVARRAAAWFIRLQMADATEQDHQACAAWRRSHDDHERAWQLAARFDTHLRAIPPEVGRSTLQRSSVMDRRTSIKALATLVILGSAGVTLSRQDAFTTFTADISTGTGERREVTLEDGTRVHLNTDSAVDILYSRDTRALALLKGEIFVSTAPDSTGLNRPFFVRSANGSFRPLGTRFSIRQFASYEWLSVQDGAVAVTPRQTPGVTTTVEAGQQANVTSSLVTLLPNAAEQTDWIDGVLRVEQMRLEDFVNELGRYRPGWTRCQEDVADLRISGVFQLDDTDSALAAIALTLPVRIHSLTRYWVTVGPA
jgi:transmembrane sensor